MPYPIQTRQIKILADTFSPVGIYLRIRDLFPQSILLESSDYHAQGNHFSYLCCDAIATFSICGDTLDEHFPDGTLRSRKLSEAGSVPDLLVEFMGSFSLSGPVDPKVKNGLFGYTSYEAVQYFDSISLKAPQAKGKEIPLLSYSLYRFIIAIDHFREEAYLLENRCEGPDQEFSLEQLEACIRQRNCSAYPFATEGDESSNLTDEEFRALVRLGKAECQQGNVFQVVLSREFRQGFRGDEFNVYRALRSINPSPYLFYFDFGDFRIFGSSPEAQLVIRDTEAQIHPIAGTFRRTGDDEQDRMNAERLRNDAKERAEHVMLVDLARNDLSRNCSGVKVAVFAETQFFSHVIHLVSRVSGQLERPGSSLRVFADTFPAGTLSGAPKIKAMQIIDACEPDARGYYGGAIGYIDFNGDLNHAIIIRSFLSKDNQLYCRAGAGIVIHSSEESELQEVNHKLRALKNALQMAAEL